MILASALALILGEPAAANQAGNIDDLTNILNKPTPGGGDQAGAQPDCEPQGLNLLGVKMKIAVGGADRLRSDHPARVKLDEAGKPIVAASSAAQSATARVTEMTKSIPNLEQAVSAASDKLEVAEAMDRVADTVCQCGRKVDCNISPAGEDLKILEQFKVQVKVRVIYYDEKDTKYLATEKYFAYAPKEGERVKQVTVSNDTTYLGRGCMVLGNENVGELRQQLEWRQAELRSALELKGSEERKLAQAQQDLSKAKAEYGGLLQAAEAIAKACPGSDQPAAQ